MKVMFKALFSFLYLKKHAFTANCACMFFKGSFVTFKSEKIADMP